MPRWRISRGWRRYGPTPLTLDPYPGAIGGQIGGCVELPAVCAGQPSEVTLACVHSYISGSGKNRSRREKIRWEATGPAGADSHPLGARLRSASMSLGDCRPASHRLATIICGACT